MKQFSEVHLKAWKKDYQDLINKKRIKLNEENVWMLGKTNGVICFFLNEEIAYICHSKSIYQTLNDILNIKRSNELIKLIMIHDLGISENKINQKKISKALSNKIKKVIRNFEFSLLKINSNYMNNITNAFIVISDPTYNGHTAKLNKILDNLPDKKTIL
ncbi:MAG: hypothetical protein ACJ0J5_06150 [Dehalococcoidia bacterium]|nr:MAG: hypothetical protein CBD90_03545 [Chloroflexi bacterium TMED230]RZP13696.1 MAG: hypothetical protein EVA32_03340 [Chloroflexota bacterium]|tara:strand:- start:1515 stop:1994 length:480 start_codon:yes stop_codon:yes gene_type:complete